MKKHVLLSTLFILGSIGMMAQTNLLTNGDFETGDKTGWESTKNLTVQTAEVRSGTYAGEITKEAYFSKKETVIADQTFKLTCYAKNETVTDVAFFSAQYHDGSAWRYIFYYPLQSSDWNEYSFTIKTKTDQINNFRLAYYKPGGDKIWIDDVELVEITDVSSLSDDNTIINTSIGMLDTENKRIVNVPKSTITAEQLINALELPTSAQAALFSKYHRWIRPTDVISDDNTLTVVAENGVYEEWAIVTGNHFIKSVSEGAVLDNENFIVSNITPILTVAEFKATIELFDGATVEVLDALLNPVTDQANTIITADMITRVTGTGDNQDYSLELRSIGTANNIVSIASGTIDEINTQVTDLPQNIDVAQLIEIITVSDYATLKITDNTGVQLEAEAILDATNQIRVYAENGDEKIYAIVFGSEQMEDISLTDQNITVADLYLKRYVLNGKSELHITAESDPAVLSKINLNSEDSWLFFDNIKPQYVADNLLSSVKAYGITAVLGENVRVVQYVNGTVIIPHASDYKPVTVFKEENLGGESMAFEPYTFYKTTELGLFNDAINSFTVKRGYYVTMAQNEDGTGFSKVFIAHDEDLVVNTMPLGLENKVSFIRVIPWRWPNKKGYPHGHAESFNSGWRYNWSAGPTSTLNVEYVPIQQHLHWPNADKFIREDVTHLLGMNEPDRPDQANCSVEEALAVWPKLMKTGLRLGSPAPSDGGLNWLFKFIEECDKRNYRVDFVAMHWYLGCQSASSFYNRVKYVHDVTGRPIWITEWNNGADWTGGCKPSSQESNAAKIQAFLNMLDNAPFVERYCIFDWLSGGSYSNWSLWEKRYDDDTFTPTGLVYRNQPAPMAFNSAKEYDTQLNKLPIVTNLTATLDASLGDAGHITLQWDDVSEYENGCKIERSVNGGAFTEIARLEQANITTWIDEEVTFGNFRYKVRQMIVGVGNSGYSNKAEVTNMREGDINVALQKTVTVSSDRSSYEGSKAVDGGISDNANRWITGNGAAYPHWIEIDLEGVYEISFLKLYTGYGGYNKPVKDFKFQYWDGASWVNLVNSTDNEDATYQAGFTPTVTNKVRLEVTKSTEDVVRLYEIEVYGKDHSTNTSYIEDNSDIWVYPNPANQEININGLKREEIISIYSTSGTLVKQVKTQRNINISDLNIGVYIIKTEDYKPIRFIKK